MRIHYGRSLSTTTGSCVGRCWRQRADELAHDLPVTEYLHRWDAPGLVWEREFLVDVDVDLDERELAMRASASRCNTGPSIRQGPHQEAQKSTTTGSS
jgi:hypothetical protein